MGGEGSQLGIGSSACLVFDSQDGHQEVSLESGYTWKIGRSENSQIQISDHRASRNHAVIQRTETGDYYLIDMGSRNGSFVNDVRVVTPVHLKDGDQISIGGYPMLFRYEGYGYRSIVGTMRDDAEPTQAWFVRQLLTVVVVDVRNFTGLAQKIDQAVLCQAIGTWFRQASEIMQAHGSWALKYIGDAVMAVWLHRAPGGEARDILQALRAVSQFAQATSALESTFALPFPMRIGAGVNTGYASVGNTGTGSVTDYTALGDAVNAAFRIETATKEIGLEVAIGNTTFEALRQCAAPDRCFQGHSVALKGYDAPSQVWAVSLNSLREFLDQAAAAGA